MFRNNYDSDITTWSPQGRLFQVEYAMEAVKQGSAAVGLKSKTHSVLVAIMRSSSELASHQKKVFKVDDHMGIAISGLTADARLLCKFMRNEALHHKFVFESPLPVGKIVSKIGDKSQVNTQRYGRRPFGVGLLVAGYDDSGSHLWYTCPSGNFFDYRAMAMGARSQSAKTYLERNFAQFEESSLDQLIKHGLTAIKETLQEKETLSAKNCAVAIVGHETPFAILDENALAAYLTAVEVAQEQGEEMAA
eukprot:TRINITY_DN1610_c0_g1_i1.p1 TRINITY_DN1610_c0_g1~~TRINITY_DN1610_c0_g1_i1.p1  ORF type:complete len:249 (+),score=60.67 TRINITY_DN1610_c0_g1_i1:76-822(+)